MVGGNYSAADFSACGRLMQQLRQRYPTESAYRNELSRYGISQQILEEHIRRQLKVLQFISFRFGSGNPYVAPSSPKDLTPTGRDLSNWLDKMRKQTRIVFKMRSLQ